MSCFPTNKSIFRQSSPGTRSSALVIVLAMVTILSAMLVAFLSSMRSGRLTSFSYNQSIRVDELSQAGLEYVLLGLRREIMEPARSTTFSAVGGPTIYFPQAPTYAPPERMTAAVGATLTNLVKISSGTAAFYANGPIMASVASSGTASRNGRSITRARWNRTKLIDDAALGDLTLPSWVIITRQGTTNIWNADLANRNSDGMALGRFAFAVYDVGGLLDVNVAGYPAGLNNTDAVRWKGPLAFADLSQIPGVSRPSDFVAWRNATTSATVASYTNLIYNYGVTNGFRKVSIGDRALLSRQDLIAYAQANGSVMSPTALPYLTTFTREKNTPTFSPATPAGSSINYAADATSSSAVNPNLATLRASSGQLALTRRFPLSRLALLSGGSAADIRTYFGLARGADGYSWTYKEANGSNEIKTLDVVALEGRQPNFFELLKAVILRGSLGLYTAQAMTSSGGSFFHGSDYFDASLTRHLLTIGANIIDQYDSDSMPTIIQVPGDTSGTPVAGIENIPYLSEIFVCAYRPTVAEGNSQYREKLTLRLEFEVWNPHQNATTVPTDGPSLFRIVARDGAMRFITTAVGSSPASPILTSAPSMDYTAAYSVTTPYQIQFSNLAAFAEPTVLTTSNSANNDPANGVIGTYTGISMGTIASVPDNRFLNNPTPYYYNQIFFRPDAVSTYGNYCISIEAQFRDSSGNWQTFQRFPYGSTGPSPTGGAGFDIRAGTPQTERYWLDHDAPAIACSRVDPRGSRWGVASTRQGPSDYSHPTSNPNKTLRPDSGTGANTGAGRGAGPNSATPNFWPAESANEAYTGMLSDNDPANLNTVRAGYRDMDRVIRRADGNTTQNVLPLMAGRTTDRPLILNRPFRSVAELGYAFRDIPWKTLDFFTADSADAALMDVFTIYDDGGTLNQTVAGKINLNTRRPAALAAMLTGGGVRELQSAQTFSATAAKQLAEDIVAFTATRPLVNKADLVTAFLGAKQTQFDANYLARKTEREAVVRALADVGQTRTWNLLVDVVAQSGKYPPGSSNLDQFDVTAERRYWFHVALDRYTGEILEIQSEQVYE